MALDRDELAARVLVALVARDYPSADTARFAVNMADALLARLRPEAVAPAPRPEWVRITSINEGHCGSITAGRVYRVTGWGSRDEPFVTNNRGETHWSLSAAGREPDPTYPTFASWEPCAAPSPAASPAPYVPKVGDVVKHTTETDKTATADSVRVVVSTDPLRWVYVGGDANGEWCEPKGWEDEVRFVRPATPAERAAAGLLVDESATKPVDRVALAKALNDAHRAWVMSDDQRDKGIVLADAAIAFMAKGGAS